MLEKGQQIAQEGEGQRVLGSVPEQEMIWLPGHGATLQDA